MNDTRFANLRELARLDCFELRDGRLTVTDPSMRGAIDVHTHLALAYGLPNKVDLDASPAPTEHYLPAERALDLDVYINRNFTPDDLKRLEHDLTFASLTDGGMRRTHTLPNLTGEMRDLGLSASVLLPIDFPVLSHNATTWLKASARYPEIVCFGSIHPYRPGIARRLDAQKAMGARGVKVHPAVQMHRPDASRAMKLYKLCGERQLPVLFHCGPVDIETRLGRYLSQVRFYEKALAENPHTTFVLGHSGALQMPEALEFAKRYPNVWLEVSSQSLTGVKRILDEAPSDRVLFGTDWPFYHQAIGLAKVFLATKSDEKARRRVLHDNAARLFGL